MGNRGFRTINLFNKLMTNAFYNWGHYVQLSYLGRDYTNSSTNVTEILIIEFDEVLVLSETRNSREGIQNHGLIFTYKTYTGEY